MQESLQLAKYGVKYFFRNTHLLACKLRFLKKYLPCLSLTEDFLEGGW